MELNTITDPILGDYISLHRGNAADESIRYKAASGGVVTALLSYMFDERIIDKAVAVAAKKDDPSVSVATVLRDRGDAFAAAGSRYAFVSIRSELQALASMNTRVACVGLSCDIQAIKKSFKPEWQGNIQLVIGIFCGRTLLPDATAFILQKLNIQPGEVRSFDYRAGRWPGGLRIETKAGKVFHFSRSIYNILNPLFSREVCLHCRDLFNVSADISVGDAWYGLPDKKGYSTVIIRNERAKDIFERAVKKGYIQEKQITPETVYKSHGHLIRFHRHQSRFTEAVFYMIRFGWLGKVLKMLPFRLLYFISKLYNKRMSI